MKNTVMGLLVAACSFGTAVAKAEFQIHDHWHNRAGVARAAGTLAEEVEALDTALHNVHAPDHVIAKVHHYEETVNEFADGVNSGMSFAEAAQEMGHIQEDMGLIRQELNAHPHLLFDRNVNQEWRHVRTSVRNLQHEMFFSGHFGPHGPHGPHGVNKDVEKLKLEMAEIEAAHE